jgi:hypothetical protein
MKPIYKISITRLEVREKPKWMILRPRMWWRKNWPAKTVVKNDCGFEIKENTVFELQ